MVEQRVALAGCPVPCDSHASPLAADEELDEVVTRDRHLTREAVVTLHRVQTRPRLRRPERERQTEPPRPQHRAGADQIRIEPP